MIIWLPNPKIYQFELLGLCTNPSRVSTLIACTKVVPSLKYHHLWEGYFVFLLNFRLDDSEPGTLFAKKFVNPDALSDDVPSGELPTTITPSGLSVDAASTGSTISGSIVRQKKLLTLPAQLLVSLRKYLFHTSGKKGPHWIYQNVKENVHIVLKLVIQKQYSETITCPDLQNSN